MALAITLPGEDGIGWEALREPRAPVRIEAMLLMYRARCEVVVTDLSRHGAMVEGETLPARGDEVVLAREGFQVVATVAWRRGGACGLAFHRAIDADTLAGRRRRTMRRSAS